MQVKTGDYVILNMVVGKKVLVKCIAVSQDGKKCRGIVEGHIAKDKEEPPVEFKAKEIIANLGNAPSVGSVYGLKIEPVRERMDHPFWGHIVVHHPLNDDQRSALRKSLQTTQNKLKQINAPKLPIEMEVRTQVGKMAGFYKHRPKAETDVLCIKLDDDMSDLEYRTSHEFAHGIWYRCFTPKMKMAWVKQYHAAVSINAYSDKDLKQLLDDIKTNGDLRGFAKENPDDMPVLRAIFRHIKQTHSVERQHFELALMLGEDVDQYWPNAIELGEKQTLLTTYAEKSPEELWAEAFSLKFIGKKLPAKLADLLDNCMRRLVK